MKHTTPSTLVLFAVIGVVGGFFLDAGLAAAGEAIVMPPYSLAIVLLVLAVIVVLAALPVRRAVRDRMHNRVDPFYAMRVVVLAKAAGLTGSLLGGGGLGILIYLVGRSSVPGGVGSVLMAAAMTAGAVALLVGGLVAERMCTIPPDDENEHSGPAAAA